MQKNNSSEEINYNEEAVYTGESLSFVQRLIFSKLYSRNSNLESSLGSMDLNLQKQKKQMRIAYKKRHKKLANLYNTFKKLFNFIFYLIILGMIIFILWAMFFRDFIILKDYSTKDFNIKAPSSGQYILNQKSSLNSQTYIWSKTNDYKISYIKAYVYNYPEKYSDKQTEGMASIFDNYFTEEYLNKDMMNNWIVRNVDIKIPTDESQISRLASFEVYDNDKLIGIQREKHIYLDTKEIAVIVWSYKDENHLISKADEIINSFKN